MRMMSPERVRLPLEHPHRFGVPRHLLAAIRGDGYQRRVRCVVQQPLVELELAHQIGFGQWPGAGVASMAMATRLMGVTAAAALIPGDDALGKVGDRVTDPAGQAIPRPATARRASGDCAFRAAHRARWAHPN